MNGQESSANSRKHKLMYTAVTVGTVTAYLLVRRHTGSGTAELTAVMDVMASWLVLTAGVMTGLLINAGNTHRRESSDAARNSDERWQLALEHSHQGIWEWNIATGHMNFSAPWKNQLGYHPDELEDGFAEWKDRIHPCDRLMVCKDLDAHVQDRRSWHQNEHRIRCKDGGYRWILNRAKTVEWCAEGKPVRIIGTHTDISDRKEAEARIRKLAYFDDLTSLPNRRLFIEGVQQALANARRQQHFGAVLCLDIDNFRAINDSLGHSAGDALLRQVAGRLRSQIRSEDVLSRPSGDEFFILLPRLGNDADTAVLNSQIIGEKLLNCAARPFLLNGNRYHIGYSIGATVYPGSSDAVDDLLKQADTAMFQAKKSGRNSFRHYRPDMQITIDTRLALTKDLRQALEQGELSLEVQPQIDSHAKQILGGEALLRWRHPQRGQVPPDEFIPVAEESGLILELGDWVFHRVAAMAGAWEKSGVLSRGQSLSVNVSPNQFQQPAFVDQFTSILDLTGVAPASIELEITEGAVIRDVDDAIRKMNALRKLGMRFALDDFGTGYSSLSYLKRLPLDKIKIDRSFTRDISADPNDAAIIQTIISMARHLGLEVIAEGVETEEQLTFLKHHGCHTVQGFYFSRPVTPEQFEALLDREQATACRMVARYEADNF